VIVNDGSQAQPLHHFHQKRKVVYSFGGNLHFRGYPLSSSAFHDASNIGVAENTLHTHHLPSRNPIRRTDAPKRLQHGAAVHVELKFKIGKN